MRSRRRVECPEHNGLHIAEDHFIVETIDPDTGEVLPAGEEGELVFTSLTKTGLPMLRYRTRDISKVETKYANVDEHTPE